jgi:hypothetical protein
MLGEDPILIIKWQEKNLLFALSSHVVNNEKHRRGWERDMAYHRHI